MLRAIALEFGLYVSLQLVMVNLAPVVHRLIEDFDQLKPRFGDEGAPLSF